MSQFRNNLKPASGSVAIRPESSGPRKLIFRQEDRICRIGAERRKTAAGSPKGERSESICRIHRRIYGVLEEKQKCDEQARGLGMEGKMRAERLKKV
jgi:hypothetical protein